MTVNGYFSLLEREGHDLHHVQHRAEVSHAVVTHPKVVEVN